MLFREWSGLPCLRAAENQDFPTQIPQQLASAPDKTPNDKTTQQQQKSPKQRKTKKPSEKPNSYGRLSPRALPVAGC